jgi:hypothetical protein
LNEILERINQEDCDIVCVAETWFQNQYLIEREESFLCSSNTPITNRLHHHNGGIAIFCKPSLRKEIQILHIDVYYIIIKLNNSILMFNYFPPSMNEIAIEQHLNKVTEQVDVCVGDINLQYTTPNDQISNNNPLRRVAFESFFNSQNLVWRHPDVGWAQWDHCYSSQRVDITRHEFHVQDRETMNSDHGSILLEFYNRNNETTVVHDCTPPTRFRTNKLRFSRPRKLLGRYYDRLASDLQQEIHNPNLDIGFNVFGGILQ